MSDKISLTPDVGVNVSQNLGISAPRYTENALTSDERVLLDKAVQISPNNLLIDKYDSTRNAARAALLTRSPHVLAQSDEQIMNTLSGCPLVGDVGGGVLDFVASGLNGLGSMSKSAWGSASDDSKDTLKKIGTAAGAVGLGLMGGKALKGLAPALLMRNNYSTPQTTASDYSGIQSWASSPKSGNFGSDSDHPMDVSSPDVLNVPVAFYQKMADLGKAYAVRAEDEAIESLAGDPVLAATHPTMMGHAKYPPIYLTPDGKTLPTVHAFSALQGGWFKNIAKKVSSGVKKASSWVADNAKKGVKAVKKAAPVIQKVAGVASLVAPLIPGGAAAMPVLQQISSAAGNVANMANTYGDKIVSVANKVKGVSSAVNNAVNGSTPSSVPAPVVQKSPEAVPTPVINQGVRMAPEAPIATQLPMASFSAPAGANVVASGLSPTQVNIGKASAMSLIADEPDNLSWQKRKDEDDVIRAELQVIGDSELAGWAWVRPLLTKAGSAALKYLVLPAVVDQGTKAFTKSVTGKGIAADVGKSKAFQSAMSGPIADAGLSAPIVNGVVTQAALSAGPRWYSKLLNFAKKGWSAALKPLLKTKYGKIALAASALLSVGFIRSKNDDRKKAFLALVREQLEGSDELEQWDELEPLVMRDEQLTPTQQAEATDLCAIAYAKALAAVESKHATANDTALVEAYREMTQSLESVDPATASRLAELSEDMADSMGPEDLEPGLSLPSGNSSIEDQQSTEIDDETEISTPEQALNSLDPSQAMLLKASIEEGQDPDKILSLLKSFGLPAAAIGLITPLLLSAVKNVRKGLPAVYGDNPSQESIVVRLFGKGGRNG